MHIKMTSLSIRNGHWLATLETSYLFFWKNKIMAAGTMDSSGGLFIDTASVVSDYPVDFRVVKVALNNQWRCFYMPEGE